MGLVQGGGDIPNSTRDFKPVSDPQVSFLVPCRVLQLGLVPRGFVLCSTRGFTTGSGSGGSLVHDPREFWQPSQIPWGFGPEPT